MWFNDTDGFQNIADTQIDLQESDRQADEARQTRKRGFNESLLMSPRYIIDKYLSLNRIKIRDERNRGPRDRHDIRDDQRHVMK